MALQPTLIEKLPAILAQGFKGYQHFTDATVLPFNVLTYPSQNCTMPSFDKIIPDKGKLILGQLYTENVGINGNKEKFKNLGGYEMEVRVTPTLDNNLKDVIEILYQNNQLMFGTLVGTFILGETINGGTSGNNAIITNISGTVLTLSNISGDFVVGETITGANSGATATIITAPVNAWHQITENVNPLPRGVHEYYFDEWFDSKLISVVPNSAPSKKLPRLVWVNGYKDNSTKKGLVYSWTGGVAQIVSLVSNTSLTIDSAYTWRSLGFTENAAGQVWIVVNGVAHQVPVPADLDTSTVNIASTAGISVGDIVTSQIETDVSPIPFDSCRQVNGYMYYGNWNNKDYYQSNGFNRDYSYLITSFQAVQNDLSFDISSAFTGTKESVFHVVIDSITPASQTQVYNGQGANDASFGTSGYTGTGTNEYKVSVVADFGITFTGTPTGWTVGETIIGGTSGAVAVIVFLDAGTSSDPTVRMISGTFVAGETVTGQSSATIGTIYTCGYQTWVQTFKNGIPFTPTGFTPAIAYGFNPGTQALIDGVTFDVSLTLAPVWNTHFTGDYWTLTIQTVQPDTFKWQQDGGALNGPVTITGGYQTLANGMAIKFTNTSGHTVGDFWNITATPSVTRAWDNFYYNSPIRKPGEGYIYHLPANFWTHDTQEDSMYVNDTYGHWNVVTTKLSANLQDEAVSMTPLKHASANKVLYPYLTGHIDDQLIYVNTEKSLNFLGRKPFLELPQTGYLSDPVKLDFQASSFVGGRIKYNGKKLYISSPEDGVMHCYDTWKKYWQAPKVFPEVGILSTFGNDLICHSNVRNQSFTMFANVNGDDGAAYTVRVRTPYTSGGNRWKSKATNMSFTEGYIQGNPPITHTLYLGVNGCMGIKKHTISPIVCVTPDNAPLGQGPLGNHALGSSIFTQGSNWQEIWPHYNEVLMWHLLSIELESTTRTHSYAFLNFGVNATNSADGNNDLVPKQN